LQNQSDGLGDAHEITLDFGMRDGDRSASGNLVAENAEHAARGIQHIAEAHRAKGGAVRGIGLEFAHDEFGEVFRGAHHSGGVHSLIGRDEDEFAATIRGGGTSSHERADRIVADRLGGLALHERHMLVRGGVENESGFPFLKDGSHPFAIADIGGNRFHSRFLEIPHQFLLQHEQGRLRTLDQHQPARAMARQLATKLRANASAGSGDQNNFPADKGIDGPLVDGDGFASQQILGRNMPKKIHRHASLEHHIHGRENVVIDPRLVEQGDGFLDGHRLGAGYGEKAFCDRHPRQNARQILDSAQNLNAVKGASDFRWIVVNETHHPHAKAGFGLDFAGELGSGVPGTNDGHAAERRGGVPRPRSAFPKGSHGGTEPGESRERQHKIHHDRSAGNHGAAGAGEPNGELRQKRHAERVEKSLGIGETEKSE
jgi:hypothetical protein